MTSLLKTRWITDEFDYDAPGVALDPWVDRFGSYADAIAQAAISNGAAFAAMWHCEDFDPADFSEHAGTAWERWGDLYLSRDAWREMFEMAGFRADGEPADRPTAPLTLWRGATPAERDNWSWADLRDAAVVYSSGVWRNIGLIWRAEVEPDRLMACITSSRYREYIVDTADLEIVPDGLWCRCPVDMSPFREDASTALTLHELVHCTRA